MKYLFLLAALCFAGSGFAQNDTQQLKQLYADDDASLRGILSYPDSARQMAYTASTYPQGFIKLKEIQQSSATAFRDMASAYCRNRQKQIWEVSRYSELPALLLANRDKSKKELTLLLQNYPEATRKAAMFCVKNYAMLLEMEQIRRDFETRSGSAIASFPDSTRKAFASLLKDPELFSMMTEDIATIISLGDCYKSNASLVKHFGDSVHTVLAEEERREYEDWKAGINSDPSVQGELKKVSEKYATENGDDVYDQKSPEPNVVINVLPFPFWAGYPYWYRYPYWRPYPWWYDIGFYWGPGGSFIFTGMPSYQFGWWYYGRPYYYRRFHRTSHYIDHHYQAHPRSQGGFNRGIRDQSQHAPGGSPRNNTGGGSHQVRRR